MNSVFVVDDALLESVLPNNLISVEGEESLANKVAPYVSDAFIWLSQELLGDTIDDLDETTSQLAMRAVVMRAVIAAVPALDLVVTPSGFGVVSSSSLAPASKERVKRLIDSLSTSLDSILVSLFELLQASSKWRESRIGSELCGTLTTLRDAIRVNAPGGLFDRFRFLREVASDICSVLATQYLGNDLMRQLTYDAHFSDKGVPAALFNPLRFLILDAAELRAKGGEISEHAVYTTARNVIDRLPSFPELFQVWKMDTRFMVNLELHSPSRPGAYFF